MTDPNHSAPSGQSTVAILGAGTFGTVLANLFAENGQHVRLHTRSAELAATMRTDRSNPRSLPGHALHHAIRPEHDLAAALKDATLVLYAVPSSAFRTTVQATRPHLADTAMLVSTTKGIEGDGFRLMSDILKQEIPAAPVGVLSGPNLAEEIAGRQLTASVIASTDATLCTTVQQTLHTSFFRVYTSRDPFGVELAGALKNIYAIAAGFAAALQVGHNTLGMLLTRSLAEMSRFAHSLGANPLTFLGLSGVGDLFVTCSSPLSRNYQIGYLLGQGHDLASAQQQLGRLAEGINTVRLVREQAIARDIYMPLACGLYEILYTGRDAGTVINDLMLGDQTVDVEFTLARH